MTRNARNSGPPAWEHFSHQADIGIRGYGTDPGEAFEQAAIALTAVISDPMSVRSKVPVDIRCDAPDLELLLVDWLNALIFEMATRHMLFSHFRVRIEESRLEGTAWGEKIERARHQPSVEVKGATYTELRLERLANGRWLAQCVVDV